MQVFTRSFLPSGERLCAVMKRTRSSARNAPESAHAPPANPFSSFGFKADLKDQTSVAGDDAAKIEAANGQNRRSRGPKTLSASQKVVASRNAVKADAKRTDRTAHTVSAEGRKQQNQRQAHRDSEALHDDVAIDRQTGDAKPGSSAQQVCSPPQMSGVEERCNEILAVADELVAKLQTLSFAPPVTHVYNPLVYAREPYDCYIRRYGGRQVQVLLLGMNPGPFGMCQSGVPFGDCPLVRDYLHVSGEVHQPDKVHPKRPIDGLDCPRREVSGQRLWGWVQQHFPDPHDFFSKFFIANYCPLAFMEASSKNRTPNMLPAREREPLTQACNHSLRRIIAILRPRLVVGIGKYAEERIRECVADGTAVGQIMHPSPANPAANKNWGGIIEGQLRELGVEI